MSSLSEHVHRIAEHARRFAFLPLIGGKSELPEHDGDLAELEELADRVLATVLPDALEDYEGWWHGYRIMQWAACTGISFRMDPWPDEQIAAWHSEREQLLAVWRAEREAAA